MNRYLTAWTTVSLAALITACSSGDEGDKQTNALSGSGGVPLGGAGGVLANGGTITGPAAGGSTVVGGGGTLVGGGGSNVTGMGGMGGMAMGSGGMDPSGAGGGSMGDGTCCPSGDCVCRGPDPDDSTGKTNGPFAFASYADGFRNGPDFLAGTIYYPMDAQPPFSGVVICPGWTAVQSSIAAWGPFLASHGIVLMTIDTNTTGDQVAQRDDALLDALQSLREENDRAGSPLQGKLSADRYGLMGWSMGGGGTWLATAARPDLKTGISLAGHNATAGGGGIAAGITVPSMLFAGATDSAILGGGNQSQNSYQAIPATTPKILYEMASEGHFSWGTPVQTNAGALGRYALAFQKVFLEGDERYRPILLIEGPGASDWQSTVQ